MFVILRKPEKEKNGILFVKRFIICVNQASPFYDEYNEGLLKPLNVREVGITTNSLGLDDITYDVIGDDSCNIDQFELVFVKRFGFRLIEEY